MRLSDYFPPEEVLSDAEFDMLALSNSDVPGPAVSFLEDPRYAHELFANPAIQSVICRPCNVGDLPKHITGIVAVSNPRWAYFDLHNRLAKTTYYPLPQKPSVIPASCTVSPLAYIAPLGVELGEGVVVEEFVSIKGPCHIGDGTVLHAGVKIGGEGFEIKYNGDQVMDAIHCGRVEIGSQVVLWENVTIHKAVYPWDVTSVGDRSRIGAQSHIDHGTKIGVAVKVCAGCVISGRTTVEDHAFIGPGSVVTNRTCVGAGAKVLLGSVVSKGILAGETVSGNFAIDHQKHIRSLKKEIAD